MKGFIKFIKERAVVGLAVGFMLGSAVAKLVSALITDLINPLLGLLLGTVKGLEGAYLKVAGAKIMYGHLISTFIDFLVITAVVYGLVRFFGLEKQKKNK